MEHDIYYIWLSNVCGAGSLLSNELLRLYGNAENIYNLPEKEVRNLTSTDRSKNNLNVNIEDHHIRRLLNKNLDRENRIMEYCMRNNVTIMTCENEMYPKRLRNIRMYPILLYCKGKIVDIDNEFCIAMVGTRRMSDYGKYTSYELAANLTNGGAAIVSGLAKGIDACSHKGCLFAQGYTIAVLGCGIDVVYPKENKKLMDTIIERGLVLTEYAPFTEPKGSNFPVRNRIMSGLSHVVVVVEADKRSGSLITARTGLFQGKGLFAVPGNINSNLSIGTNELLKSDAKILTSAEDILSEYDYIYGNKRKNNKIEIKATYEKNGNGKDIKKKVEIIVRNEETGKSSKSNKAVRDFKEKLIRNQRMNTLQEKPTEDIQKKESNLTIEMKLLALELILNERELEIFKKINDAPDQKIYPDSLINEKFNISEIINLLSTLEIYGIIHSIPGGSYILSELYNSL